MSEEIAATCANPRRLIWLRGQLGRVDWWIDCVVWRRLAHITHGCDEDFRFNRFLAGVHEFAWTKFCGYGWRFAAHCGAIYWGWVKVEEGPPPQKMDE